MKKLYIFIAIILVIGVGYFGLTWLGDNLAGGGSTMQTAPDSVKAGEPVTINLVVGVWGGGGSIKGRYTDLALYYRLIGEQTYKVAQFKSAVLPENYVQATTDKSEWEAYDFTVPAYPKGTTGEIEYYIDLKLDGHPSRVEGIKKIKVSVQ